MIGLISTYGTDKKPTPIKRGELITSLSEVTVHPTLGSSAFAILNKERTSETSQSCTKTGAAQRCSRISALMFMEAEFPCHLVHKVDGSSNLAFNDSGVGISAYADQNFAVVTSAEHTLQRTRECYVLVGNGERSYLLDRSVDTDELKARQYQADTEGGFSFNTRNDSEVTGFDLLRHWDSGLNEECGAGWGWG